MQGDTEILQLLNEQLTSELTSINQYFLHSKMQANWGFGNAGIPPAPYCLRR
jgi:bacterioferritin